MNILTANCCNREIRNIIHCNKTILSYTSALRINLYNIHYLVTFKVQFFWKSRDCSFDICNAWPIFGRMEMKTTDLFDNLKYRCKMLAQPTSLKRRFVISTFKTVVQLIKLYLLSCYDLKSKIAFFFKGLIYFLVNYIHSYIFETTLEYLKWNHWWMRNKNCS